MHYFTRIKKNPISFVDSLKTAHPNDTRRHCIHRYYLNALGGPFQLKVVLVGIIVQTLFFFSFTGISNEVCDTPSICQETSLCFKCNYTDTDECALFFKKVGDQV